jgi:co-chaperonin GroES (HSP10)
MSKKVIDYLGNEYESNGIDLNNFDKEAMIAKFKNVVVTGCNILILIYKKPIQKQVRSILLPDSAVEEDLEYNSMVGMVLKVGVDAYKGDQFPNGDYAKVGDWVIFPRGSSLQAKYEAEPIIMVEDFKIKLIVEDPSKVSR